MCTTAFIETITALLYPLKWAHVCVPVVPAPLVDLVEAPVPFMLGLKGDWLAYLPKHCLRDVLLVDCDTGCLAYGSTLQSMYSALDKAAYTGYWFQNNSTNTVPLGSDESKDIDSYQYTGTTSATSDMSRGVGDSEMESSGTAGGISLPKKEERGCTPH